MRRRDDIRFGFELVFWRELRWLKRRPLLLAMTTVVPAAIMALLMMVFGAGLATKLPVGVLDLDGSELSRQIVRTVDATPDVGVARHVADLAEGRRLIEAGRIYGLLMLPKNLERDVLGARRPEVVFFYNSQMLTAGNVVLKGVNAAIPTVAGGMTLSVFTAQGLPAASAQSALQPVPLQISPLFNPSLSYVFFLLATLLPAILQIVVTTTLAYSVGLDVETAYRLRVLGRLGGGLLPALAGKLLPYTVLFLLLLGLADAVLFGWFAMPLLGSRWILVLAAVLFILTCQFIGALLALLLKNTASAVSLATLLTASAFGFMGIGFPRFGMNAFSQGWGALMPGTWFLTARIDQTVRGAPLDLSLKPVLILAIFTLALGALTVFYLDLMRRRIARQEAAMPTSVAEEGAA